MVKKGFIFLLLLLFIFTQAACITTIQTIEVTEIIPHTIIVPQTVQVIATPYPQTETPDVQELATATPPLHGLPVDVSDGEFRRSVIKTINGGENTLGHLPSTIMHNSHNFGSNN